MNSQEFDKYIDLVISDYKEADHYDYYEFANQSADSSEYVIYTAKAWDLVSMVKWDNSDAFYEAEETVKDYEYDIKGLDDYMTIMAYAIIYNALIERAPKHAAF